MSGMSRWRHVVVVTVLCVVASVLPGGAGVAAAQVVDEVVEIPVGEGVVVPVAGGQVSFAPQPAQIGSVYVSTGESGVGGSFRSVTELVPLSETVATLGAADEAGRAVDVFPHAVSLTEFDGSGIPESASSFEPGVELTLAVVSTDLDRIAAETVAVYRRSSPDGDWKRLPSAYDPSAGLVVAHAERLGEFAVFGLVAQQVDGPTVVLDPDNDRGQVPPGVFPEGPESELQRNLQLVAGIEPALEAACGAKVVVTRGEAPDVDRPIRAAVARNANPDLTVTLAFNTNMGQRWGTESGGGVRAWGSSEADKRLAQAFLDAVPEFTGRPATSDVNGIESRRTTLPYSAFDDVPGPHAHIEMLFLDHAYDHQVIVNSFDRVIDAAVAALTSDLEAMGFDCGGPVVAQPAEANLVVDANGPRRLANGDYQMEFDVANATAADGAAVAGARLTLSLGDVGNFVSAEPACSPGDDANELVCPIGAIAAGATSTVAADFAQAAVAYDVGWAVIADNAASRSGTFSIPAVPEDPDQEVVALDLSFEAPAVGTSVDVGEEFLGRIRIENMGDIDVNVGPADDELSLSVNGQRVQIEADVIEAGASILVTFMSEAPARAGEFPVVAELTGGGLARPVPATRRLLARATINPVFAGARAGAQSIVGVRDSDSAQTADPVQVATGNFLQPELDLDFGPAVFGMEFGRFYNSAAVAERGVAPVFFELLGPGWRVSHQIVAFEQDDGVVTVTTGDGRVLDFVPAAAGAGKPYERPPLFYGDLYEVDGNYVIANYDGTRWFFDDQMRVVRMTSPDSQVVDVVFAGDQITRIESSTGLSYQLAYGDVGLIRVDTTDGASMDRFVEYLYSPSGFLAEAVDPDGEAVVYTTDETGLIERIEDQAGVLIVDNEYDMAGRVKRQENGAGEVAVFRYFPEELYTEVDISASTGPGSARTDSYVYEHNDLGFTIDITDPLDQHIVTVRDPDLEEPMLVADRRSTATGEVGDDGSPEIRTVRSFDDFGNVLSESIPDLGTWTYTYLYSEDPSVDGAAGLPQVRLESVTPPWDVGDGSSAMRYSYTGTNVAPSRVEGPLGYVMVNEIVDGLVMSSTDSDGVSTRFVYDEHRRLVEVFDGVGNRTGASYDMPGRVIELVDAFQNAVTIDYDETGRPISSVDRANATTAWAYDPAGRVEELRDPLDDGAGSSMIAYGYHPVSGLATSVSDQRSNTIGFGYNGFSQLTSVELPGNADDEADGTATYTYGWAELGRRISASDPLPQPRTTTFEHDEEGQVERVVGADPATRLGIVYDEADRPVRVTDANGVVSTTTYSPRTGLVSSRRIGVDTPDEITIGYLYDAAGRVERMVGPRPGESVHYTYTPAGRLDTVSDSVGKNANGTRIVDVNYSYDAAGRVETVTTPGTTAAEQLVTKYFYDENSRIKGIESPFGLRSEAVYDADDRLTSTATPADVTTTYSYNDNDTITSTRLGDDGPVLFDVDSIVLNGSTDPNGATATYGYDDRYNMTSRTDQRGNTSTYTFDEADQLVSMDDPLGRSAEMQYDLIGRLIETLDASGRTYSRSYDDGGRLERVTFADGSTQSFTYDFLNRVTSISDQPENTITRYAYDKASNLTKVTEPDGDTIRYTWDKANNRTSIQYPNGDIVTYRYDARNRMISANHPVHGETTYEYDADDRVVTVIFPDGPARTYEYTGEHLTRYSDNDKTWNLTYDPSGRIEEITGEEEWSFTYNSAGQLTNATRNDDTWAYSYDPVGNLISATDHTGTTTYTHDTADQLATATTDQGTETFTHDESGRLLTHTTADNSPTQTRTTYDYDIRGRLNGVTQTTATNAPAVDNATATTTATIHTDEQPQTRQRRQTGPTASVVGLCDAGAGVFEFTLTASASAVGDTEFVVSVSGLSDRTVAVAAGETETTRRTGRRDGTYDVAVTVAGHVLLAETLPIACGSGRLEARSEVVCTDNGGQLVMTVTNGTATQQPYAIEIPEFIEYVPANGNVAAGATAVIKRSGRPDGTYTVTTTSGPAVIASDQLVVDCVPGSNPTAQIRSVCVNGDGAVVFDLTAAESQPTVFTYGVSGLDERTVRVEAGNKRTVSRSGRPDGTYQTTVTSSGHRLTHQTTNITCDLGTDLAIAISATCSIDTDGGLAATITNPSIAPARISIETTASVNPTTTRIDHGETKTLTLASGLANASHTATITVNEHRPTTQTAEINCINSTDTWTRSYTPDGLLDTVTHTNTTWRLNWDRTYDVPMTIGWDGPSNVDLLYGIGPALAATNGSAVTLNQGPLGDIIGSTIAVASHYTPYGQTETTSSFGLGYRGELHTGPTVYLKNRDHIPALRRFHATDPLTAAPGSANKSPYQYAGNDPFNFADPTGLAEDDAGLDSASAQHQAQSGDCGEQECTGGLITYNSAPWYELELGFMPDEVTECYPSVLACSVPYLRALAADERSCRADDGTGALGLDGLDAGCGLEAAFLFSPCKAVVKAVCKGAGRATVKVAKGAGQVTVNVAGSLWRGTLKVFGRGDGAIRKAARTPSLSIDSAQFGKKVGKHAQDFGLDPSDPAARAWVRQRIETIHASPAEVRQGAWHPTGGGGNDYFFFREGSDVLVTDASGGFATILPGGQQNSWFANATAIN